MGRGKPLIQSSESSVETISEDIQAESQMQVDQRQEIVQHVHNNITNNFHITINGNQGSHTDLIASIMQALRQAEEERAAAAILKPDIQSLQEVQHVSESVLGKRTLRERENQEREDAKEPSANIGGSEDGNTLKKKRREEKKFERLRQRFQYVSSSEEEAATERQQEQERDRAAFADMVQRRRTTVPQPNVIAPVAEEEVEIISTSVEPPTTRVRDFIMQEQQATVREQNIQRMQEEEDKLQEERDRHIGESHVEQLIQIEAESMRPIDSLSKQIQDSLDSKAERERIHFEKMVAIRTRNDEILARYLSRTDDPKEIKKLVSSTKKKCHDEKNAEARRFREEEKEEVQKRNRLREEIKHNRPIHEQNMIEAKRQREIEIYERREAAQRLQQQQARQQTSRAPTLEQRVVQVLREIIIGARATSLGRINALGDQPPKTTQELWDRCKEYACGSLKTGQSTDQINRVAYRVLMFITTGAVQFPDAVLQHNRINIPREQHLRLIYAAAIDTHELPTLEVVRDCFQLLQIKLSEMRFIALAQNNARGDVQITEAIMAEIERLAKEWGIDIKF